MQNYGNPSLNTAQFLRMSELGQSSPRRKDNPVQAYLAERRKERENKILKNIS